MIKRVCQDRSKD